MAVPGTDYWAKRAAARMDRYLWRGNEALEIISKAHQRAQADIQAAIDRIYARMGKNYDLTKDEITQLLAQPAGREEYLHLLEELKTIKNPAARQAMEARASSGAYAYRVSRLDALKEHVRAQSARLADVELAAVTDHLRGTISDAYNRSMYDLQRGTGLGFSFAQMGTRAVSEILHNPWSGRSFSARIWQSQDALAQHLNEQLTAGFMSGKSNAQLSRDLADTLGSSYRNAERLVRTETCYMANAAEMESYKEAGIEKYEFMATLDMRTSAVCQDLDGQVFAVKDAVPGKNMPPMHPHCRSTTVAHFDDVAIEGLQRRARDPITGEDVFVPRDMTYSQWQKLQEEKYGPEKMALVRKMQTNLPKDKKQYELYLSTLGKKQVPTSFADFQKMKYTDDKAYQHIKLSYRQELQGRWERGQVEKSKARQEFKPFERGADIPSWMLEQSKGWSDAQKESFTYYSSHEYSSINTSLRRDLDSSPTIKRHIQNIAEGIDVSPVRSNAVVWRGTYFSNLVQGQELKALPLDEWPGTVIHDKAFSSTSVFSKDAFTSELTLEILVPSGSRGAYIADISEFPNEHEMLLQKGQRMVIIEAEMRGGKYHVKARLEGGREQ